MKTNLQAKDSVTVLNAYATTSFYDDIERAMADSDSKFKIIT